MLNKMNWNLYGTLLAEVVSWKSKDPSTQVGAVIMGPDNEIRSTGYNGFGRGINDDAEGRWDRPEKYLWVVHAEENAIVNAARNGVSLNGCTLFLNWEPIPCNECCKAIVNSGIKKIVGPKRKFHRNSEKDPNYKNWNDSLRVSVQMLGEARIKKETVEIDLKEYMLNYINRTMST